MCPRSERMKAPTTGRHNLKPCWRLMGAIFYYHMRKVLGFDQWQLRDLQTESNSCWFLDFHLLLLPVLIPIRSPPVANKREPNLLLVQLSFTPWVCGELT